MLLLTAIVLLIGFIALSGMVIRVSQLPEETTQESRRPIDLEAVAVTDGVRDVLARLEERIPIVSDTEFDNYNDAVEDSLASIAHMEQGRGFRFQWVENMAGDAVTCMELEEDVTITVSVTVVLYDLDTRIQVTVSDSFGDSGDPRDCIEE